VKLRVGNRASFAPYQSFAPDPPNFVLSLDDFVVAQILSYSIEISIAI
jgi:hypothetical protein